MHGLHNLMSYCSTAGKAWAHLNIFWKVQPTPSVDKIFKSLVFYSSRGVLQEMLRPLKISSAADSDKASAKSIECCRFSKVLDEGE